MTAIYIDADACPVKDETLRVAERHQLQVFIVANGGIRPSRDALVEVVIVAREPDAADIWIAERIGAADICITGDIPLADRCIKAGAQALNHNGEAFSEAGIGQVLAMRDLMADLRAANPLDMAAGGGGRAFTHADRSRFLNSLERLVRAAKHRM